jgi:hypothetical protein
LSGDPPLESVVRELCLYGTAADTFATVSDLVNASYEFLERAIGGIEDRLNILCAEFDGIATQAPPENYRKVVRSSHISDHIL